MHDSIEQQLTDRSFATSGAVRINAAGKAEL